MAKKQKSSSKIKQVPVKEKKTLTGILMDGGYITEQEAATAKRFIEVNKANESDYFLSHNIVSKDILGQAMAESFGVTYADLNSIVPSREQIRTIPEPVAKKYRVILFKKSEKNIVVATDNPSQANIMAEMKKVFPKSKIVVAYGLSEDIDEAMIQYRAELKNEVDRIVKKKERIASSLFSGIVEDAIARRASDIHLEPHKDGVDVRFRIDSVMQNVGRVPHEYYDNIVNHIKVRARLRIDEHMHTQDGSVRYEEGHIGADLRISLVPTLEGEKVVMRVLSRYVRGFTLGDLGFSSQQKQQVGEAIKKPFGMILTTGPTGSGKTTTLYSLVKILNRPEVNITTIEDPVEYRVRGVNQIQVNPRTELTFANGLRSIVRQDPDIILVGEIRDRETAEISVNAALTGHLLLSTFHANDAATSIPRLLDMGIEPFLLASTLEVVVAQRLVRKICESCRYSVEVSSKSKEIPKQAAVHFKNKTTIYKGKGCAVCSNTGYRGRSAIFEIINITPEMESLILTEPSTQEIWKLAQKQGSVSLFEDGIEKIKEGITTFDEVMRVAAPAQ